MQFASIKDDNGSAGGSCHPSVSRALPYTLDKRVIYCCYYVFLLTNRTLLAQFVQKCQIYIADTLETLRLRYELGNRTH